MNLYIISTFKWIVKAVIVIQIYGMPLASVFSCDSLMVDNIIIHGREKTKIWVMHQEARVTKGQKIAKQDLDSRIKEMQTDLIRTNLFASVECEYRIIEEQPCLLEIHFFIEESWLLMASPIFELSDKNFTVWWDLYNRSLDRVNYGIKVFHYNLTGRKDRFKLKAHSGFTNKFELSYDYPYINRRHNVGLWAGGLYSTTKELNIMTLDNQQVFYRNESQFLQSRASFFAQLKYRPTRYYTFSFMTEYHSFKIHGEVYERNPEYLSLGKTNLNYFQNRLNAKYSSVDLEVRPTEGFKLAGSVLFVNATNYKPLSLIQFTQEMLVAQSFNSRLRWVTDFNFGQTIGTERLPYLFSRALGYLYDTEGYEYYVLDGLHFFHSSTGVFYKLFSYKRNFFKILGSEPRIKINIIVDLKLNGNLAYVYNPWQDYTNTLTNTMLRSVSAGFDILLNQSLKLQLNYSLNHLGQSGFFIQSKSAFR
ncbi:MAG: hypothetical protein IPO62_03010 [Saprospiraceae bacterium]|nr:hypothetical protein [Saprospiraceae bacterium]MBK9630032.1 hypothetical protein [Saprospiraceae bacterium]